MSDPIRSPRSPTPLLQGLPTRPPVEVRTKLTQIAASTGGWIEDEGERYWLMSWCHALTITGFSTPEDAAWAASFIRADVRGPHCRQWHAILDTHICAYVGESLFTAFCQSLPSTLNVLAPDPRVTRLPTDRFRHVLFPGLPPRQQPWLVFRPMPIYWYVGWHGGNAPGGKRLRQEIAASGLTALLEWLVYEVKSQPQWHRTEMAIWGEHIWEHCPRDVAIKLVPALHTFLTDLVARIASAQGLTPALVGDTNLEASRQRRDASRTLAAWTA